eukprot:jgi/Hompol1/3475/HPOL_006557-RA
MPSSHTALHSAAITTSLNQRRRAAPVGRQFIFKSPKELLMSVQNVVKTRSGSVLARGIILKSDHFETGLNSRLDFHLQGAPNFRMADMNVFGVAQPTVPGITTVLTLLACHPAAQPQRSAIWFSTREEPMIYINNKPFIIRDATSPTKNIKSYQGISALRLEQVENRLKEDIYREEQRWNGLVLVHEEMGQLQSQSQSQSYLYLENSLLIWYCTILVSPFNSSILADGSILPLWLAIDSLQTPREVFEDLINSGFNLMYVRIPIGPEQAPEDHYIDEYVNIIRGTSTQEPLVFNCGMGVGRTTFAMVLAMLIRRKQTVLEALPDPFANQLLYPGSPSLMNRTAADELVTESMADIQNRSILRIVYVVHQGKSLANSGTNRSAIEWALARGALMEDLRNAINGDYMCIQQLKSLLADGSEAKMALDQAINR